MSAIAAAICAITSRIVISYYDLLIVWGEGSLLVLSLIPVLGIG